MNKTFDEQTLFCKFWSKCFVYLLFSVCYSKPNNPYLWVVEGWKLPTMSRSTLKYPNMCPAYLYAKYPSFTHWTLNMSRTKYEMLFCICSLFSADVKQYDKA